MIDRTGRKRVIRNNSTKAPGLAFEAPLQGHSLGGLVENDDFTATYSDRDGPTPSLERRNTR
jgi:hypothetical protein